MSEEDALWAAIDAMPEDALRRLVLADWLVENDTPGGPCVTCGGHGLIDESGNGCGDGITCQECRGFGEFTPDGRADMAMALRATCTRVPRRIGPEFDERPEASWWWNSLDAPVSFNGESHVGRELFDSLPTGSPDALNPDIWKRYRTAAAAIRDLCRAWVAVHCKSKVPS